MKGILGLGMPMVAVPVIAYFLPPTTAMMLLCFPILSTNFLQMQIQKGLGSLRFLPLLIFLVIGLIVGGRLIVEIELKPVSIIIAISNGFLIPQAHSHRKICFVICFPRGDFLIAFKSDNKFFSFDTLPTYKILFKNFLFVIVIISYSNIFFIWII